MAQRPSGFPSRADLWLDGDTVVRRHPHASLDSLRWQHRLLTALASRGVAVPAPVRHFGGASVAVVDGVVTSAVTRLQGEIVGWSTTPSMPRLGRHLAAFHDASATIDMRRQRPDAFVASPPLQPIHGDPTNHNVLVDADREPCGLIDFENACLGDPLFDIACALWRSGRPFQEADGFDAERINDYLDGYSSRRPLDGGDRRAVVAYLSVRGQQIIDKQRSRGIEDDGPRRRLAWLATHGSLLA